MSKWILTCLLIWIGLHFSASADGKSNSSLIKADPETYTCHEDADCFNKGECVYDGDPIVTSSFCSCRKGTEGDYCETVTWCIENEPVCSENGLDCRYSTTKKTGYCKCPDDEHFFDLENEECRITCAEGHDCLHGGKCQDVGDPLGNYFCSCLNGTEGDWCEEISWCDAKGAICDEKALDCEYSREKSSGYCRCPVKGHFFDMDSKQCRNPCLKDRECRNGGMCKEVGDPLGNRFCSCKEGIEGSNCEKISWCVTYNATCEEKGLKCVYSSEKKTGLCECPKGQFFDMESKECRIEPQPQGKHDHVSYATMYVIVSVAAIGYLGWFSCCCFHISRRRRRLETIA